MASEFYGTLYVNPDVRIPEITVNQGGLSEIGSISAFFGTVHVQMSAEQGRQLHAHLSALFKEKVPAMSPDEEAAHRLLKALQDSGYHIVEASDGR